MRAKWAGVAVAAGFLIASCFANAHADPLEISLSGELTPEGASIDDNGYIYPVTPSFKGGSYTLDVSQVGSSSVVYDGGGNGFVYVPIHVSFTSGLLNADFDETIRYFVEAEPPFLNNPYTVGFQVGLTPESTNQFALSALDFFAIQVTLPTNKSGTYDAADLSPEFLNSGYNQALVATDQTLAILPPYGAEITREEGYYESITSAQISGDLDVALFTPPPPPPVSAVPIPAAAPLFGVALIAVGAAGYAAKRRAAA